MAGAGDAEHRELSLAERVTKLEADIEFDSLPLRKLKDWLEADLLLDGKANLVPGSGGAGDDGIDGADGADGTDGPGGASGSSHRRPFPNVATNDFVVPTYPGPGRIGGTATFDGFGVTVSFVRFVRFVAARDLTANYLSYVMKKGSAAIWTANRVDVGLYSNDGSTLLCSSGAKDPTVDLGISADTWRWVSFAMNTPPDLSAGLVYVMAIQGYTLDSTSNFEVLSHTDHLKIISDSTILLNGGSVTADLDIAKWSLSGHGAMSTACGGTAGTTLPSTLSGRLDTEADCTWDNASEPVMCLISEDV